jgi:hypothetical protein
VHRLAATLACALLACAAGTPRPAPPPAGLGDAPAREVLSRFCRAAEAGRWEEAHLLLSARWRAAYTPGRLAADRAGAGPAAGEAAGRVLAALAAGAPLDRDGQRALLAVAPGRAAVLVAEDGGWRVDALE